MELRNLFNKRSMLLNIKLLIKKRFSILLFCFFLISLSSAPVQAQTLQFSAVAGVPFVGVYYSSIAFADIDGDNDADVLLTGEELSGTPTTKLYTNDGNGVYTEVLNTPFEGVLASDIAFADVNGDGDLDVLITGSNSAMTPTARLYFNNGGGNFLTASGNPFTGVYSGSVSFADIDGDNDLDVLICGSTGVNQRSTKLYTNSGYGLYTLVSSTPFPDLGSTASAFADVDGDGDSDLLITGESFYLFPSSLTEIKLFLNDGNGNFTDANTTAFESVSNGDLAFSDIDGDGDQDVMISGQNATTGINNKLYTNDGNGNFSEVITPFSNLFFSSVEFSDIDGDGDQDVLTTGLTSVSISSSYPPHSDLYLNDGSGNFTLYANVPFEGVGFSSSSLADIDGDGDIDVLLSGKNINLQIITRLYRNVSCNPLLIDSTITQVNDSTLKSNASGNYTYQWIDCDHGDSLIVGATSQTFTATENGSYAVRVTSADSCSMTSDCFDLTSIGGNDGIENIKRNIFRIYPNPTKAVFTITVNQKVKDMPLDVYSPLGRLIYHEVIIGDNVIVDLKNYASGIYIIRLNNKINIKVIKL